MFPRRRLVGPFLHQIACMLVVVAKQAKQFPVAAVQRIVLVVVILVVYGELPKAFA